MIKLKLIRSNPEDIEQKYTAGEMFIRDNKGGFLDFGFTLEPKVEDINKNGKFDENEIKVYGKTAIPFGNYKGQVTWSNRFKRKLPLLFNVDKFEGVRIHSGNTLKNTKGCILIGYKTNWKDEIYESAKAEKDLVNLILQNDENGYFEIEII